MSTPRKPVWITIITILCAAVGVVLVVVVVVAVVIVAPANTVDPRPSVRYIAAIRTYEYVQQQQGGELGHGRPPVGVGVGRQHRRSGRRERVGRRV